MSLLRLFRLHLSQPLRPLQTRTYAASTRISRLESRLPKFLRHLTTPLRTAPVSHITAFLILHEITAIVPLFGLAALFHYTNWLPTSLSEGAWVRDGTEKFGRYLRRKGWIGEEEESALAEGEGREGKWWATQGNGNVGVRIVAELATAYAVTKAALPARLALSVWGTPWFARVTVLPVTAFVGRVMGRKSGVVGGRASAAAGTGAVGGGVGPAEVVTKVK